MCITLKSQLAQLSIYWKKTKIVFINNFNDINSFNQFQIYFSQLYNLLYFFSLEYVIFLFPETHKTSTMKFIIKFAIALVFLLSVTCHEEG